MRFSWKDRLFLLDPGFLRTWAALRGTLTVGLSFLVLYKFTSSMHQPLSLAFIGVILALFGSIAVKDADLVEQKLTLTLLPVVASLNLVLGLLLAPHRWISSIVFLLVTFTAIAIRRFGNRYYALGMMAYMSYSCSLMYVLQPHALLWAVLSVFLAALVIFILRIWVMPEKPTLSFQWTLQAYRLGMALFMREMAEHRRSKVSGEIARPLWRKHLLRLHDLSVSLDDFLDHGHRLKLSAGQIRTYRGMVFEMELAVRRVMEVVWYFSQSPTLSDRENLQMVEWVENAAKDFTNQKSFSCEEEPLNSGFSELKSALESLVNVHQAPDLSDIGVLQNKPAFQKAVTRELHPSTKQAIQATLGTMMAMFLGRMVSEQRWYWAAITVFLLFSGATRGDQLNRALQRVMGTVVGLILGLMLALALKDFENSQLTVIFLCLFAVIYTLRSAYFWTTLWFSCLLAIFYGLLGQLDQHILWLRVEETLVGAGASALMVLFIFPISTRGSARLQLSRLLRAHADLLSHFAQPQAEAMSRGTRRAQVRQLEKTFADLRQLLDPLASQMWATGGKSKTSAQGWLHEVGALLYYTRHFVVFFTDEISAQDIAFAKSESLRISEISRGLADVLEKTANKNLTQSKNEFWVDPPDSPANPLSARSLARIEQLLIHLKSRLNAN